jgi:protein SCO1/2
MRPQIRGSLRGLVVGLAVIVAVGGWLYFRPSPYEPGQLVGTSGEAKIGGAFALTNHLGQRVVDSDFRGRLMLVYFGYTFCPDVCPLDMARLAVALDILERRGADLSRLQALFVTIDPARDSPQILDKFVTAFHPQLMGLTGSPEQIAKAAAAYKVYYAKAPGDEGTDYLMNHSNNIYVMGPDGKFISFFSSLDSTDVMADQLSSLLKGVDFSDGA